MIDITQAYLAREKKKLDDYQAKLAEVEDIAASLRSIIDSQTDLVSYLSGVLVLAEVAEQGLG